jgi:hypothetical protein
MPLVLIPSDNRDFVGNLAAAYRRRGWDAVVGVNNFDWDYARYDLVHLQWPEELCGWEPPSPSRIAEISARLDRWNAQGRLVLTVHNVRPHRRGDDPRYQELFEAVYERVPVLAHFTEVSRGLVASAFPQAAKRHNVVTGFFSFDALLQPGRTAGGSPRASNVAAPRPGAGRVTPLGPGASRDVTRRLRARRDAGRRRVVLQRSRTSGAPRRRTAQHGDLAFRCAGRLVWTAWRGSACDEPARRRITNRRPPWAATHFIPP